MIDAAASAAVAIYLLLAAVFITIREGVQRALGDPERHTPLQSDPDL